MARPAHTIAHLLLVEPLLPSQVSALKRDSQAQLTAASSVSRKRKRSASKTKSSRSPDVGSTPLALLQRELDLLLVIRHREKNAHGSALWYRRLGQHVTLLRRIVATAQALLDGGTVAGACPATPLVSDKSSAGTSTIASTGPQGTSDKVWRDVEKISYDAGGQDKELLLAASHDADALHWPGARPARYAPSLHVGTSAGRRAQRESLTALSQLRTGFLARWQLWAEAYGALLAAGRYVQLALVLLASVARCRAAVAGIDVGSGKIVGDDDGDDVEYVVREASNAALSDESALHSARVLEMSDEDAFDLGQVIARSEEPAQSADSNLPAVRAQTAVAQASERLLSDDVQSSTGTLNVDEQVAKRHTGDIKYAKQKRADGGGDRQAGRDKSAKKKKRSAATGSSAPKDEIDDIFG